MQAHEIMITSLHTMREDETVRTAVEKMIRYGINGLPVTNSENCLRAYVSDGDIMKFIGRHQNVVYNSLYYVAYIKGDDMDFHNRMQQILGLNIMEIASSKLVKVDWDEEIENVAAILGKKQIKNLPVEKDGKLVGIISRGDIIRHYFRSIL